MKKFASLLLALSLTLCLAGCGGGTSAPQNDAAESNAQSEDAAQTPDDAQTTDDTQGAQTSDDAQGADTAGELTTVSPGKLTMSTNASFPPYEMTTDAGGFEGIDVEIAGMIAEKLGLELQIDDMEFDSALLAVQMKALT